MLTVVAPGPFATIQDGGRVGWAAIGVPRSGAADRASAELANRLVGNRPDAAVVEATAGGLRMRAERTVLVAVAGAAVPLSVDGRAVPVNGPVTVPAGSVLALGTPSAGLRSYLAVRGGVDVPAVLGSRSTDTLSGLGPSPLAAGDRLPVGRVGGGRAGGRRRRRPAADADPVLRVLPGPRRSWLAPDALDGADDRAVDGHRRQRPGGSAAERSAAGTGARTTSCPARGWCPARSRCPRTAPRCCSWPTTRSPAATRCSPSWPLRISQPQASCAPARRSGSGQMSRAPDELWTGPLTWGFGLWSVLRLRYTSNT